METPPTITCDDPHDFPWSVLHDRHPALVAKLRITHAYPPAIDTALADLVEETLHGIVAPLPPDAHDRADWHRFDAGRYFGEPWSDAPFLFAESYFYRRVLDATDYFRPGPWHLVDPFRPEKRRELAGAAVDAALAALADVATPDRAALTDMAVWGNRADLVFLMADPTSLAQGGAGDLLADDGPALWRFIDDQPPIRFGYVADNTGLELLHDLVLIDHLLARDPASTVTLYLKPRPYFVSDAMPADLDDCVDRLATGPPRTRDIAARLTRARADRRLLINDDALFCAPVPYPEVDLAAAFAGIDLTILKGDLNYRRLVGDRHWRGTEPFAERSAHFPSRVACLRTVKSEVVVGLDADRLAALDATEPGWRITGRYAVVQARL